MKLIIHKLISILLPPLAILLLLFLFPPYLIFKYISHKIRSFCREDVAGKVVLITGASSGIGEHLAYEYARRGARLALVARREDRLCEVADKSLELGSPDVIVIPADVSNMEHCKRFIDKAVNYFGRLDHLVNNAAIVKLGMFEDVTHVSEFAPTMNTNFWGSAYGTHFAVPHLRKSKGKIIVIASVAGWMPLPKISFYNAGKAALVSFYETLRVEFGSDIGITIVTPGLIETDMVQGEEFTSEIQVGFIPSESAEACAKAIVASACRGDRYLTEPSWYRLTLLLKILCPELLDSICRLTLFGRRRSSKKTS
ncbi:11-beta-hydroxysteroid dehydrogenase 1B-like [Durio zibethinus]|uniref:11-beta-hydroxysteroid dehydrogenase 1B-like n=1 Tax=Durio zibethinus TaxID=66656 RepID=A0A6P6B0A5_DURZI|nr:11-beta-hydroxysteroid dehydrogenase 1B-like [Durio zibethinus]